MPALCASEELPDRRAALGTVSELPLPGFRDGRNDLPQDPRAAADLVPGDLLRGPPQAGHLGSAVPARYRNRQLPDGLDAAAQAALHPLAPRRGPAARLG